MNDYVFEKIDVVLQELEILQIRPISWIDQITTKIGLFNSIKEADASPTPWQEWENDSLWGGVNVHQWFKATFSVDTKLEGADLVLLVSTDKDGWLALNPQFLLFVDGTIKQGLDTNHQLVFLGKSKQAGESYRLDFSGWSGMLDSRSSFKIQLGEFDQATSTLYFDLLAAFQSVKLMDRGAIETITLVKKLNQAVKMLDLRQPRSKDYYASVRLVCDFLKDEVYNTLTHPTLKATCVGHAHIDVAWLWTIDQTRLKTARTFASSLDLMERYPEFIFLASQPQLYRFVSEDYPELYKRIIKKIHQGKWEAEGGMWVESDCNLTSGESLVRQFLYGKQFFNEQFGKDSKILWLPDAFGYNASLPQIMKQAGIEYFMTTKINWNQKNQLPVNTFFWRGIDGSTILSHIITTVDEDIRFKYNNFLTTYNGMLGPDALKSAWDRYLQKNISNEVLISYGYGDGGGGVTWEMLELARRLQVSFPSIPAVVHRKSKEFFDDLNVMISKEKQPPIWDGELYLEYHRGTLTSMARNKRFNRKAELLFQRVEWLASLALLFSDVPYPKDLFKKHWLKLLCNQFHDILPGSSIKEVYEVTDREYHELFTELKQFESQAMKIIADTHSPHTLTVFNSLGFERSDIIYIDADSSIDSDYCLKENGIIVSEVQQASNQEGIYLAYLPNIPSMGYKTFRIEPSQISKESQFDVRPHRLENQFFIIELDNNAEIIYLWDKQNQRQIIKKGKRGNSLIAYEDKPIDNDNWDIESYYQDKAWPITDVRQIKVVEKGPIRAGICIRRVFNQSSITQHLFIYRDIPRIDFVNEIDWHQDQILLRVLFPIDIHARTARFDIPFGSIERPTHNNTSWEQAAFEVPVQKWQDVSERGYGVALINDCKYGASVKDGVLGLSLIKSGNFPNKKADREVHAFTYSLFPHQGDWVEGQVNRMSYMLNQPLQSNLSQAKTPFSLICCDKKNIIIENVKQSEEGPRRIIVRVYEDSGKRTIARFTSGAVLKEVNRCNLLEEIIETIEHEKNTFILEIHPFEIVSIELTFHRGQK